MNEALIPYVPYPVDPSTNQPVETKLRPLDRRADLRYRAALPCAETGLMAPILAVTIHPESGAILPLCGTHTDNVTQLPVAIEVP